MQTFVSVHFPQLLAKEKHLMTKPPQALQSAFAKLQRKLVKALHTERRKDPSRKELAYLFSGASVIVALVVDDAIFVASVGDCAACLARETPDGAVRGQRVSVVHHPASLEEQARMSQSHNPTFTEMNGQVYVCLMDGPNLQFGVPSTR